MIAIIFALFSYLGWGIGDIFATKATRQIGGYNFSFYLFVIGFILQNFYVTSAGIAPD